MNAKDRKGIVPSDPKVKAEVYESLYNEELERRWESAKKIGRLQFRTEYLLALLWESRNPATIIN